MILVVYRILALCRRAPRIRGDDPFAGQLKEKLSACSPHPRG